jgi:hypothetical protein
VANNSSSGNYTPECYNNLTLETSNKQQYNDVFIKVAKKLGTLKKKTK